MRKIFDVFLFYNELDLLELRLRELYDDVDYFVITEVDKTFSGKSKPFLYRENQERFKEFQNKIIYNPIFDHDIEDFKKVHKYTDPFLGFNYKHNGRLPNSLPAGLKREINHRDSCIVALASIADASDLVLLSDVDEIPNVSVVRALREAGDIGVSYFEMKHYMYRLTCRVDGLWYGTVAFNYRTLTSKSMDNLRYASSEPSIVPGCIINNGGWHFSYMGGSTAIATKLDALAWQGFRAYFSRVLNFFGIKKFSSSIAGREDILMQGRKFIEESETVVDWPQTLREYPHLAQNLNGEVSSYSGSVDL